MKRAVMLGGTLLALLYLIEAVLSTGLFAFVWPVLGGLFAAAMLKRSDEVALTAGSGTRAALGAGAIAAVVLIVAGTPLTYVLLDSLGEQPGFFGRTLDMGPIATLLVLFAGYALYGLAVAAATGAITGWIARER